MLTAFLGEAEKFIDKENEKTMTREHFVIASKNFMMKIIVLHKKFLWNIKLFSDEQIHKTTIMDKTLTQTFDLMWNSSLWAK